MEGLAQLMDTVRLVQASLNPGLAMEGILLAMFDARTSLHKQVAREMRTHFGDGVFETVIPRSVKLSESPSFGKPIVLYDPQSKGGEAYMALAREVASREPGAREPASREAGAGAVAVDGAAPPPPPGDPGAGTGAGTEAGAGPAADGPGA